MPLDPSIALQGRGVQITAPDPTQTLMTVAQLKNLQAETQLRQLNMAQLGATLQQYRGLQAPGGPLDELSQLAGGSAQLAPPGMVAGPQLGGLPPGGGALTQAPMGNAPAARQVVPTPGPTATTSYVNAPPPGQVPAPAEAPPMVPGGQEYPPGASAAGPSDLGTGTQSARQAALYREMLLKFPLVAPHVVQPLIAIDQQLLQQRKGELEFQTTAMGLVNQAMSTVLGQPADLQAQAYAQMRQVLIARGVPGVAQQLPPQFNAQLVATFANNARDAKTRVEQQLQAVDKEIQMHGKITERMKEEREARAVTMQPTASGIMVQPTHPLPGQRATPLAGPTGAPALPPEYGKQKEFYDAQGNVHLGTEYVPPGQQPRVQRPAMAPTDVPGYATPPGGVPAPPQLMNQEAVQKNLDVGRHVQGEQLTAAIAPAEAARTSLDTLSQMKRLMHQGYYDDLFAKDLAGADAQKALIAAGRDPQKLANTFQIQNLANQLVIDAQGGRGLRVGPTEIGKLEAASGRLGTIPPKAAALQTVEQLRQLTVKDLEHYNTLAQSPNTPQLRPYAVPQTVTKAEFDKRYTALKAAHPTLTKDELALHYERAGVHVEGAY